MLVRNSELAAAVPKILGIVPGRQGTHPRSCAGDGQDDRRPRSDFAEMRRS